MADALHHRLNKTIIEVRAGGAPLKLSTEQLKFLVGQVMDGTFDERRRYYIAMLAAAFSTTTTDVVNFDTSQDLLAASQRDTILRVLTEDDKDQSDVNEVIPPDDPLSILDANIMTTFQEALLAGEVDPCNTSVVEGETDLLCAALRDQDLFDLVLQVPYPLVLCHSPEDTLVTFASMPTSTEAATNENLSLEIVTGGHESAALRCFLSNLLFFVGNIENYNAAEKHNPDGCEESGDVVIPGIESGGETATFRTVRQVSVLVVGLVAFLLL